MKISQYFFFPLDCMMVKTHCIWINDRVKKIIKYNSFQKIHELFYMKEYNNRFVRHGKYKKYFPDGHTIQTECLYVRGKKEGSVRNFYLNHRLQSVLKFHHGKKHGKTITFFKHGEIQTIEYYQHGKQNGLYMEFFPSGKIYKKTRMSFGRPFGKFYVYHPEKAMYEVAYFSENRLENVYQYSNKGQLQTIYYDITDERISYIDFDSNTIIVGRGHLNKFKQKHGIIRENKNIFFYQQGKSLLQRAVSSDDETTCSVCFEKTDFQTLCFHPLCLQCCEKWYVQNQGEFYCPLCRSSEKSNSCSK